MLHVNLIHAVGRADSYYVILLRFAETAVNEVDSLVGTVAEEDTFGRHTFNLAEFLFHLFLQWIGIAVVRIVVGILIGIQKYVRSMSAVFVTCT